MRPLVGLLWTACAGMSDGGPAPTGPDDPETTLAPPAPVQHVRMGMLEAFVIESSGEMLAGDLDGDGDADLAWLTQEGVRGLAGHGDGRFEPHDWWPMASLEPLVRGDVQALAGMDLGDLDGDGTDDVVLSLTVDGVPQVGVVREGRWEVLADEDVRVAPVVVSDLDGDALPEVVVSGEEARVLASTGEVWTLGPELDSLQYPRLTTREGTLVLCVDYAFGITEVRSWSVGSGGLVPQADIRSHYAHRALFGEGGEVLLLGWDVAHRFDGVELDEVLRLDQHDLGRATGGDFDGDGALDVLADGAHQSVLFVGPELSELDYEGPSDNALHTLAHDFDGDGLDDMARMRWADDPGRLELTIYRNVSAD